ncbi:hypothetical protein GEMRC1_008592 [Eukaryota sp. GEM-RC1]
MLGDDPESTLDGFRDQINEYYVDGWKLVNEYFDLANDYLDTGDELIDQSADFWDRIKTGNITLWQEIVKQGDYARVALMTLPFVFIIVGIIIGILSITICKFNCCFSMFNICMITGAMLLALTAIPFTVMSVGFGDACSAWNDGLLMEYIPSSKLNFTVLPDAPSLVINTSSVAEYYLFCEEGAKPIDIGYNQVVDFALDEYYFDQLDSSFELMENYSISVNSLREGPREHVEDLTIFVDDRLRAFVYSLYQELAACSVYDPAVNVFSSSLCTNFVDGWGLYALGCILTCIFSFVAICSGCCCASPKYKKKGKTYKPEDNSNVELQPMVFQPQLTNVAFQLAPVKNSSILPQ